MFDFMLYTLHNTYIQIQMIKVQQNMGSIEIATRKYTKELHEVSQREKDTKIIK